MNLCVAEQDFLKKIICPENWENGPKMGQKQDLLNLLKNLVINFFFIFVPAQISYLGKILFLRYGQKFSQPIRLQGFLIKLISRANQ